jgi:recombination protein RecT
MAVNNSLAAKPKQKFSVAIQGDGYKNLINSTLGDPKRAARFIASVSSAVAVNPALQDCDAGTILSSALLGESLNLSPSPQLGQYYMVPFNDNKNNRKVAQFQLGYKGYIQLAVRSGQYKKLNVLAIKEGELVKYNPLEEEIEVNLIEDEEDRESAVTVGYYAMFEYVNGFKKAMYWSKKKMEAHALRYSKGYAAKKGYTFWENDFDGMAYKTMLRQLISKWGIMSVDLQTAYEKDTAVIKENGEPDFVGDTPDDAAPHTEAPEPAKTETPQAESAQQLAPEAPQASEPVQQGFDFFAGT